MDITKFIIQSDATIRRTIKKLDEAGHGFMVIYSGNQIAGVITDGDTRRAILKGIDLDDPVKDIMNRQFISLTKTAKDKDIEHIFLTTKVRHIPILQGAKLVDIIFKDKYFLSKDHPSYAHRKIDLPVVIMAGGKGVRLDPFTRILPKPLIPIGEKAVIEIIMESLAEYGMGHFYISVNHKAKMIKAYFEDMELPYKISYLQEDKPLGTAGALQLLGRRMKSPFFVFNCDTIIEEDFSEILDFHKQGRYALTLVGVMQQHVVPYGVCEMASDGHLKKLKEKPSFDFLINTGLYLMNPEVLEFIPAGKKMEMPDLIEKLMKKKHGVGVYPISEDSWIDIGQWEGYKKAIAKLKV